MEKESLTIKDAEYVPEALLQHIMGYPDYPKEFKPSHKNVIWNNLIAEHSIGVFPLQGAVYLKNIYRAASRRSSLSALCIDHIPNQTRKR